MIQLIGPGGAGKTTAGAALANRLGVPFVDLDAELVAHHGDVSAYLEAHGYEAYAAHNVSLYFALTSVANTFRVFALSSGFMTYRPDVHPCYPRVREQVASDPSTFVLLPTFDLETCVAENVRRQLTRSCPVTTARRTRNPHAIPDIRQPFSSNSADHAADADGGRGALGGDQDADLTRVRRKRAAK